MIKYFFIFSIIATTLLSCSKEEGEGGRSSISGIIEGSVISVSRAETTIVTVVPGHEIKGKDFFLLNTPGSADNYVIWFRDLDNVTGAPTITNRIAIRVDYNKSSSSNISVAISIETALNAIAGTTFTIIRNNDIITITNNTNGDVIDADNGISKLVVDVTIQGKNQITLQNGTFANEDVFIIYGDEDEIFDDKIKTNYDGTFKFNNLRKGTYKVFAYSEDESSTSEPLTPIFIETEVGGSEAIDIGTILIEKK